LEDTKTDKSDKKSGGKSRPPKFQSAEEEARFWDTHSPLDFSNEFKEVEVKFERPLQHVLGVRFEAGDISKLGEIARKEGIGPSTLARIWIMERLSEEAEKEEAK
jgi:hypothetical protein